VIMVTNLAIGCVTPPVGVDLFIASSISGTSLTKLSKSIFPFIIVLVVVQVIITYLPDLTMWLPRAMK